MPVIRIEMERDNTCDSVWEMPYRQHKNLKRDAALCGVIVAALLAAVAVWGAG